VFPHHRHHHEKLTPALARLFNKRDVAELKIDLWNAFVDSGLIGINDHDCSVIPRFLPASYLPTIRRTCRNITEALMKILSLPSAEIMGMMPPTPISDYLIDELGVLKHRPRRLTGSLRFDMAIVGKPSASNPPKLMEVNDIGFDGTGRSSYIQETILRLFPELKPKVICFDTALAEVRNMRRLGKRFARFQYEMYNWEEEVILMKAKKIGLDMILASPDEFKVRLDKDCSLLKKERVRLKDGYLRVGSDSRLPDAFQLAYSFELKDFKEAPKLFRTLIKSKTHHYSPFITGLIAPKTILTVLGDEQLRRRLIGKRRSDELAEAIIPAMTLEGNEEKVRRSCSRLVIKHADGMGGEHVYVGRKIPAKIRRIRKAEHKYWVAQDRIDLNTMDVDGFSSRRRRVVADLGVYIHYDWNGKRFTNYGISGFITRATNRSFKVNVSGGGIQVPVMFDRSR
jgi:hypothetical protein